MRVPPEEFRELDVEAHAFLADAPLRDVSAIDLPGGGPDRTISDVRALLSAETVLGGSRAVRALFALRALLGRVFRWDRERSDHAERSYLRRLGPERAARSRVEPGTPDGPFTLLYVFERELVAEIQNATVHAFSCMVLRPGPSGHRLYWAIYVKPVSRLTGLYMALIEPFRRFVVYPTLLRRLRASWIRAFPAGGR